MQIKEDANFVNKYRLQFEVTQPSNLVGGTLQQHQLEALEWMINLGAQESNGILADDMGLGKTIQAIAYMAYLKEENGIRGKHLIICPKSVANNWMREVNKWLPSSQAVLLLSTEAEREDCLKRVVRTRKFDILVTTYEAVKTCVYPLSRIPWEVMVVDEAHKIKNNESQSFIALSYLTATFKLLLTGTPLSNNLKELWCLLNFIMPGIFRDPQLFDEID
jgi:SWI/SNF-related matrix-associated actin-dependent regulator of chromatin subfamily A member 5